jgi:hypothetical protein
MPRSARITAIRAAFNASIHLLRRESTLLCLRLLGRLFNERRFRHSILRTTLHEGQRNHDLEKEKTRRSGLSQSRNCLDFFAKDNLTGIDIRSKSFLATDFCGLIFAGFLCQNKEKACV